ncbi:zincin-like metallopeptidase domain-containing protein [Cardiobacterium hominis]|uniref:zincin-like metallopeptidase domain-containing protein n=1 Tax=Cardiobacterium hominis TaxID=2718 RepID=UPI0028F09971|nr:zincin-like metallopeptidase domain-containing protein [Cardiobacterium hominis]
MSEEQAEATPKKNAEQRFTDDFISEIIEAVRNNTAPWQQSWPSGLIAPYNAVKGNTYSGRNAVRLFFQGLRRGYTDPRWATAHQIKEMQGHIRKGEKGTGILYYGQRIVIEDDGTEKMLGVVRHYYVFNIEQTNLPVLQREALREVTPDLPAFAELLTIHNPRMAPGEPMYDPNTDTIRMLDKGAFTNDGEYYSAFFHEMGHWTGHESRLNRDLTHPFGTPGYAREELVAELSSFMLSLEHGLPFSPKQSHAYLQGWAERTGQELEDALRQGFKDATAAKNFIDAPLRERQQEREQQVELATPLTSRDEAETAPEKGRAVQTETTQEYQPKHGDVVRTYYTRTGKIGAEVRISISHHETRPICYHYIGKWGAASGVTPEELSKEDAKWRTTRRGITIVDGPAAAIAFGNASLTITANEKNTERKVSSATTAAEQSAATAAPEAEQAATTAEQSAEPAAPEAEQVAPAAEQSAEAAAPDAEQATPEAEQSAETAAPEVEQAAPVAHKPDVRETSATTMTSKTSKSAEDAVVQAYVAERFDKLFRRAYDEQAMVAEVMETRRVYLAVSWDERHEAKALGAKWDKKNSCWYALNKSLLPPLQKFNRQPGDYQRAGSGDSLEDLRAMAASMGLDVERFDTTPNVWHRVPVEGRRTTIDGAYKIWRNADGVTGATVKNLVTGETRTWSDRGARRDPVPDIVQRAAQLNREEQIQAQDQVRVQLNIMRGQDALAAYKMLPDARGDEPYFARKHMTSSHGIKRLEDGTMVIPLINGERVGEWAGTPKDRYLGLVSLQTIAPDGTKMLMKQAAKSGAYFPIGSPAARAVPTHIVLAEGIATAEAAHQILAGGDRRVLAIAAIDAGNLVHVASTLQQMFPAAKKIIAVDNDLGTEQKHGKNSGIVAARAVAAKHPEYTLAIPEPIDGKNTDWNDVLVQKGRSSARMAFGAALGIVGKKPEPQHKLLPDINGLCPRDVGKAAFDAIGGDLNKLPQLQRELNDHGYNFDTRQLVGVPHHPTPMRDAFTKAIRPQPQRETAAAPQPEYTR